jgi:hypothetical protein
MNTMTAMAHFEDNHVHVWIGHVRGVVFIGREWKASWVHAED